MDLLTYMGGINGTVLKTMIQGFSIVSFIDLDILILWFHHDLQWVTFHWLLKSFLSLSSLCCLQDIFFCYAQMSIGAGKEYIIGFFSVFTLVQDLRRFGQQVNI